MRIGLYTPFKPLNHPRLSGDVTLFRDVLEFFQSRGHETEVMSHFSTEWIHLRPLGWLKMALERKRLAARMKAFKPDCWFSYHSYYKSPDLFGPWAARQGIPYFMLSGAYASKRRRSFKTRGGYQLNKRALQRADILFANKHSDYERLCSVFDPARVKYLRPGINSQDFSRDGAAGHELRQSLGIGRDEIVAVCVAMLRTGTKSLGVEWIITTLAGLDVGPRPVLLIAGDGPERSRLEALARKFMPDRVRFLGLVRRDRLRDVYSAGDYFVFPGINEGLGLVYLEAQSCGLPAVAWDHGGAKEVIAHGTSGIITPSFDREAFGHALRTMHEDHDARRRMSEAARVHVRQQHELYDNYRVMEVHIQEFVESRRREKV